MEGIIAIVLIFGGLILFRVILHAGSRTVSAAARTAFGKGSFSENMELAFQGMGPMEVRCIDSTLGDDPTGPKVKELQIKGLIPVRRATRLGFVTSVFDNTSGTYEPVLSAIDNFQEPESIAYRHTVEVGEIAPDQGFVKWVRVGIVIPEILTAPFSGRRKLATVLRLVDLDEMPKIVNGFHTEDEPGLLWQRVVNFDYDEMNKGYREAAQHKEEARVLSLKIAMSVAMADGSLADSEGKVLRDWVIKTLAPLSPARQAELKPQYNEAMMDAHAAATAGTLSLSTLTARLNEIVDKPQKYETVELCFDVMAADGVAAANELATIRNIASALDLDFDEIEKIRDSKIIGLSGEANSALSVEELLNIESDWDGDKIRKHIRTEFQKWNNRLNTLQEGTERENAQCMLDVLAEARKKYG